MKGFSMRALCVVLLLALSIGEARAQQARQLEAAERINNITGIIRDNLIIVGDICAPMRTLAGDQCIIMISRIDHILTEIDSIVNFTRANDWVAEQNRSEFHRVFIEPRISLYLNNFNREMQAINSLLARMNNARVQHLSQDSINRLRSCRELLTSMRRF